MCIGQKNKKQFSYDKWSTFRAVEYPLLTSPFPVLRWVNKEEILLDNLLHWFETYTHTTLKKIPENIPKKKQKPNRPTLDDLTDESL